MVRWYGGFDSYVIAQEFDMPIFAPSMGRKIDREDEMDIQHLPYMTWVDWINNLSQYHVGVHLMPTHAAGTFALNCAFHGIPVSGPRLAMPKLKNEPLISIVGRTDSYGKTWRSICAMAHGPQQHMVQKSSHGSQHSETQQSGPGMV